MPLFHSHSADSAPTTTEPVATVFPVMEGANIGAVFVGQRVAGDLYDSVRVSPERVLFGLLDVAGRRDENRGILGTAQQIFRNVGVELFSRSDINESDAMTELCLRINRGLIDTSRDVHPCPAFIACYHEKFGTLCYTNAGHTPGLVRDSTGIAELASTGLPLGLFSHATCDAPTIGLEKDAALLLVSRGVVSCPGYRERSGEEFGLAGVKQLFQAAPVVSDARELCASVLQAAEAFGGGAPRCDDRTALALARTA
jgi:sigma-B regulation protein RsbU (phosphoserine phosphatase)